MEINIKAPPTHHHYDSCLKLHHSSKMVLSGSNGIRLQQFRQNLKEIYHYSSFALSLL